MRNLYRDTVRCTEEWGSPGDPEYR
jgi:hypothetical protein